MSLSCIYFNKASLIELTESISRMALSIQRVQHKICSVSQCITSPVCLSMIWKVQLGARGWLWFTPWLCRKSETSTKKKKKTMLVPLVPDMLMLFQKCQSGVQMQLTILILKRKLVKARLRN